MYVNPLHQLADREAQFSLMARHPLGACSWRGVAKAVHDRDGLLDLLNRLTGHQESRRAVPRRVGDAPPHVVDKFLGAIVGIEIPIDRLEGKPKASQDEALPDRLGTVHGLKQESTDEAAATADLVKGAIERGGTGAR